MKQVQNNSIPSPKEVIKVAAKPVAYRDTYSSFLLRQIKSPKVAPSNELLKSVSIAKPKTFAKGK